MFLLVSFNFMAQIMDECFMARFLWLKIWTNVSLFIFLFLWGKDGRMFLLESFNFLAQIMDECFMARFLYGSKYGRMFL